jgi:hypothetical protein
MPPVRGVLRFPDVRPAVHLLGPAAAGVAVFVVATTLNGSFDSGAPTFRNLPATTVVWLSALATVSLITIWYLASRERGKGSSRARRSIKRRRA